MSNRWFGLSRGSAWMRVATARWSCWTVLVASGCVDTSDEGGRDSGGAEASEGSGDLFGGELSPPNAGDAGEDGPSSGGTEGGRCADVPESVEPRIDNFEDGDQYLIPEPGRLGSWHIPPFQGEEELDFEVEPDGGDDSDFAAHIQMDGFSDRVSVGISIKYDVDGVDCPYNASRYVGIGFWAKGEGNLDVLMDTTDTWSTEFGGTCDDQTEVCWDVHHKLVPLSNEWEYHEVFWDQLTQAGWGKYVNYDARHFIGMEFARAPETLPADFWVDEVAFLEP